MASWLVALAGALWQRQADSGVKLATMLGIGDPIT